MKKVLVLLSAALMVVLIVSTACAAPAPQSSPKPTSTKAPVNLELYGPAAGGAEYSLLNGLGDLLQKNHPWLRGMALETLGTVDMITTAYKLPASRKNNSLMAATQPGAAEAIAGIAPYDRKYTELRILAVSGYKGNNFVTYDANIKTMKDLVGKKVGLWQKGSGAVTMSLFLLNEAYGIQDQVKISNLKPADFGDALTGGMIDAAFISENVMGKDKLTLSSYAETIRTAKPTTFIPVDKAAVDAGLQKYTLKDVGYGWFTIPKGALGLGDPKTDTGSHSYNSVWYVWNTMDENTAYELTKLVDEVGKAGKFGGYVPGYDTGMSGQYLVGLPGLREDQLHPGALKYYKEKGYKLGVSPF